MILLDSCCVLAILLDEKDGENLSLFLNSTVKSKRIISVPQFIKLEVCTVLAKRSKEKKLNIDIEKDLEAVFTFPTHQLHTGFSNEIIKKAALIKQKHAASMIDCLLIALAQTSKASVLTADKEFLNFSKSTSVKENISGLFKLISWP